MKRCQERKWTLKSEQFIAFLRRDDPNMTSRFKGMSVDDFLAGGFMQEASDVSSSLRFRACFLTGSYRVMQIQTTRKTTKRGKRITTTLRSLQLTSWRVSDYSYVYPDLE